MAYRLPLAAALLLAVALALLALAQTRKPAANTPAVVPVSESASATWPAGARPAPDFHLRDQDGKPVSISAFRGRPVLLTFIDPLCRTYCPLEGRRLNRVVRAYPAATRPMIVAVSVNTRGNSRTNLRTVVRKWGLVPQWRFAVGTEAQLAAVWKSYHVGVLATTRRVGGVTVHDVAHTEAAYLVDAAGYERALFLWPYSANAVATALRATAP